ncbi:RcnB family protein [Massilia alkalitolerans]|uniref:RcnB family protein n=1 Tax=Massilia alkalitolerans TaxID=286638 RepID=UPI00040FFFE9|nr:RcnB family protein [Massilia alkalitolerans]
MKPSLIASALIALTLTASGSAFAQRGDHGHDGRNGNAYGQDSRRGDKHDNGRYDNDRHDGPRGNANQRANDRNHDRYYDARQFHRDDRRGAGPRHDLRRGQHLSKEYRGRRYVVTDWRDRHLSAPPRGHHWVRAGNDYILAAIATGLIAQVLLSN